MSSQTKRKAANILLFCLLEEDEARTWKRGKTRQWIKRRAEKGYFNNIVTELRLEDTRGYKEMMRMSYEQFLEILIEIEPLIARKQIQGGHKIISPAERLTLTIRFLATGESFTSLHFQFRIGEATISYIVHEVCKAIYQHLGRKYLSTPRDERKWREIATEFYARWQFPNCVGAIDGKHLVMQPPTGSGSHYVNYKHTHSVVLMAIAGPDYQCIYADVGKGGAGKGAKDLHRLAFCVQTTHKLSQVEKNLRCNLNMLKFVASHRKSSQVGGQTRHKHAQAKTCDDLRSRLIRALSKTKQGRLVDTATNLPRSGRNKTT